MTPPALYASGRKGRTALHDSGHPVVLPIDGAKTRGDDRVELEPTETLDVALPVASTRRSVATLYRRPVAPADGVPLVRSNLHRQASRSAPPPPPAEAPRTMPVHPILFLLLSSLLPFRPSLAQQPAAGATEPTAKNAVPSVALPAELDRVLRDYEQAWRNRDAGALAGLFTEDGFVLRPGHPPVRGRDAIEDAYQNSGGRLHLRALAFEASGPTAYIVGGYTSTPKWPDAGTFIITLRKGPDDRWRITADMDNRNR